jgi:hypothetical protein
MEGEYYLLFRNFLLASARQLDRIIFAAGNRQRRIN